MAGVAAGKTYYVYVVASFSRTIYIGMTNDLVRRVWQHRSRVNEGFASRYGCVHLVYFEEYPDPLSAIGREKEIKRWGRARKLALIESLNPAWRDLWDDICD